MKKNGNSALGKILYPSGGLCSSGGLYLFYPPPSTGGSDDHEHMLDSNVFTINKLKSVDCIGTASTFCLDFLPQVTEIPYGDEPVAGDFHLGNGKLIGSDSSPYESMIIQRSLINQATRTYLYRAESETINTIGGKHAKKFAK